MSDNRPELSVTDARELARAMARATLAHLPQGTVFDERDVLMDRCLTGEHCWFFFRNPAISIPETASITKSYSAYAVSRRGNILNIVDYSREPSKLEDHLELMAAYFAWKELGGPKPELPEWVKSEGDDTADQAASQVTDYKMRHYSHRSSELNFEVDIPENWTAFPALTPDRISFASREDGGQGLLVVRCPNDHQLDPKAESERVQESLAKEGFSNLVAGETTIGSRRVTTLDYDRPLSGGGIRSCRSYFVVSGTVLYSLGFGTSNREARNAMFDLFDRVAKSFVPEETPGRSY